LLPPLTLTATISNLGHILCLQATFFIANTFNTNVSVLCVGDKEATHKDAIALAEATDNHLQ